MISTTRSPPSASPNLPPKRQVAILATIGVVLVALLFGLPALLSLLTPKPPPPPAAPPAGTFIVTPEQMAALKVAPVQALGFRPGVETEGKVATNDDRTTQVFSPYSGRAIQVMAKIGDVVHAGQPLFAVEASEFAQGQSDLAGAVAQLKIAKAAEARQRELYTANGAALKDYMQSQADLVNAQAALAAVRNRLKILGQTDAQIKALENRPQDQTETAQSIVTSPIDGVVTQRSIGVGQNIGSVTNGGPSPAFVVSNLSTVWLIGNLREVDASRAQVGQAVEVRVSALPDRVFTAKVDYVSPSVDPVSRRVTVRAVVSNPDGQLKPEMFASFSLFTGTETKSVGVPEQAVIYEGSEARVWVARSATLLELRNITTGQTQNGMVQVTSGLAQGDKVVTSGALFIDRASKGD